MPINSNKFSVEVVCKILLSYGLISEGQKKEILLKKEPLKRKMEKARAMKQPSSKQRFQTAVSIVDVITALNLERADDPSKGLDEETIYQALAKGWKIPFKKIDPLKLDLNLVTTTIPHTFAMKHMTVPIERKDGYLIVATINPFIVVVINMFRFNRVPNRSRCIEVTD
jgi:general secretion pathway protein E